MTNTPGPWRVGDAGHTVKPRAGNKLQEVEMDYSKMTDDDFEKYLLYVIDGMTPNDFLLIPGVYEIVAEYFNNDVLESWAEDQEDQENEDES